MCARSMHEVVTALAYDFTSATGNEVELSFGTVGALQQRLDGGETADVVISGKPAIDALDKAGHLAPKSRADIATVRIGVAVREGAAVPDISTPEAFRQALIDARAVAFSDAAVGGSAGVYLARMFAELGLADAIKKKGMPHQNGGEVARRLAEGRADMGMTLFAEIGPIPRVGVIGPPVQRSISSRRSSGRTEAQCGGRRASRWPVRPECDRPCPPGRARGHGLRGPPTA